MDDLGKVQREDALSKADGRGRCGRTDVGRASLAHVLAEHDRNLGTCRSSQGRNAQVPESSSTGNEVERGRQVGGKVPSLLAILCA